MIKKIVFATLLCDMVFAGVGFAACNEDFAKINAAVKKNAMPEEDLVVARCLKNSCNTLGIKLNLNIGL